MKGYFAFLLVFASVALILIYLSVYTKYDSSKQIAFEDAYQSTLNFKTAMLEAVHTGGRRAFDYYASTHSTAACLQPQSNHLCFKKFEAEMAVKAGALNSLIQLSKYKTQYSILLWCGRSTSLERDSLAASIRNLQQPLICSGCLPLSQCMQIIQPKILKNTSSDGYYLDSVGVINPSNNFGFGISIYFESYDIAIVSYIPATEVVDI